MSELKREKTLEELKKELSDTQKVFEALKNSVKTKEAEEERARQKKLNKEKDTRKKEIEDAYQKYSQLLKAYIDDYGIYTLSTHSDSFDFWPSKLYHMFF